MVLCTTAFYDVSVWRKWPRAPSLIASVVVGCVAIRTVDLVANCYGMCKANPLVQQRVNWLVDRYKNGK